MPRLYPFILALVIALPVAAQDMTQDAPSERAVGGSQERARQLQERLAAIKHDGPVEPNKPRTAETGS